MNKDLILSIDNGTQSVRALLFDAEGNLVAKGKQEIEPYYSRYPGWAEQDTEYFWQALRDCCEKLWAVEGVDRERIAGLSITAQRKTVVNLDSQGAALRPAMIWLDQRKASVNGPVPGFWGPLFKLLRIEDLVDRLRSDCQANWIAQNEPEIWAKTDNYLLLSGFLNYKMTGKFRDSTGNQVGYIPFDYRRKKWARKTNWRWRSMPVRLEQLPELVSPGEVLGEVTADASAHTGIPEGLPVFASASDKACEVAGSGGNSPEIACLSFGTTATVNTTHPRYIEPARFLPSYPSAIPGLYCAEFMIYRGFWMVSWFKNEFGQPEILQSENSGQSVESQFETLVNEVPPGSMGLIMQPYWSPGLRDPGPEAKGAMIGFGDVHTRAHVYRAILEGLVFALRDGTERLQKRSGIKVTKLRVAGGGSQSDAAMQLTADIFGIPAARPHTWEASGLGAAIDVAVGLGMHPDFDTAIARMTRTGEVFSPNPIAHEQYQRLYREVYLKMYPKLRPLYQSIAHITGYPKLDDSASG